MVLESLLQLDEVHCMCDVGLILCSCLLSDSLCWIEEKRHGTRRYAVAAAAAVAVGADMAVVAAK